MPKYAALLYPGHNRVYYQASGKLALSELAIASGRLSSPCSGIQIEFIADTPYCAFTTIDEIDTHSLGILSRLSFMFVFFRVIEQEEGAHLIPIPLPDWRYIDEKITMLLKYKGKTNELFTKMMVNIAWLCTAQSEAPRLLDPMAGKGTTLHTSMTFGMDAYGIEAKKAFAHEAGVYLKKYLETERLKHTTKNRTVNGPGKKAIGKAAAFTYANSKQAFAAGDTKTVEMLEGDAALAGRYYKKAFFDMIVADLPYGVQHGSRQQDGLARSPQALLTKCLPAWYSVLKRGGVMVLAVNTRTLSKQKASDLLASSGFTILHPNISFDHTVDASIQRDIVIASKTPL